MINNTYKNDVNKYTSVQVYTFMFCCFNMDNNIKILLRKPSIHPSENLYYNIEI